MQSEIKDIFYSEEQNKVQADIIIGHIQLQFIFLLQLIKNNHIVYQHIFYCGFNQLKIHFSAKILVRIISFARSTKIEHRCS